MRHRKHAWVLVDLAEGRRGSAHSTPTSLEFALENIPFLLERRKTCYTRGGQFRGLGSVG